MVGLVIDKSMQRLFFTLYKLAEMGAYNRTIKISTELLAEKMGFSQQTASRHLIELDKIGWIERSITPQGTTIRISKKGKNQLVKVYSSLGMIIEAKHLPVITLEGVVFSGLGEGAYYVTREAYRRQFIEKLGFDPYPGTLNLKIVSDHDLKARMELENYPAIEIEGFKDKDRTFGPVKCFHALINGRERGAVVFAMRSHYNSSVLEVIAPVYLRGRLKLRDGSRVKVEIFPNVRGKNSLRVK